MELEVAGSIPVGHPEVKEKLSGNVEAWARRIRPLQAPNTPGNHPNRPIFVKGNGSVPENHEPLDKKIVVFLQPRSRIDFAFTEEQVLKQLLHDLSEEELSRVYGYSIAPLDGVLQKVKVDGHVYYPGEVTLYRQKP